MLAVQLLMMYWKTVVTMVGEFTTVTMMMTLELSADQVIIEFVNRHRDRVIRNFLVCNSALPPVMNLTVTSVTHSSVTLSWNVSSHDVLT